MKVSLISQIRRGKEDKRGPGRLQVSIPNWTESFYSGAQQACNKLTSNAVRNVVQQNVLSRIKSQNIKTQRERSTRYDRSFGPKEKQRRLICLF